jgi:hypothetical protein
LSDDVYSLQHFFRLKTFLSGEVYSLQPYVITFVCEGILATTSCNDVCQCQWRVIYSLQLYVMTFVCGVYSLQPFVITFVNGEVYSLQLYVITFVNGEVWITFINGEVYSLQLYVITFVNGEVNIRRCKNHRLLVGTSCVTVTNVQIYLVCTIKYR